MLHLGVSPKLFGIPLKGKFVYSPSWIYLFSHFFMSAWIHGCLLIYTLGYNTMLL